MQLENTENDNLLKCPACGAKFRKSLNLVDDGDIFDHIADLLLEGNRNSKYHDNLKEFPLIWKIRFNTIEESYLEHMKELIPGKYLITWPWKDVRFTVIMASEFLLNNPNSKAVIIGRKEGPGGKPTGIGRDELLRNLLYLESPDNIPINENIKNNIIKKFNKKYMFEKQKMYRYSIKLKYKSSHPITDVVYAKRNLLNEKSKTLVNELGYDESDISMITVDGKEIRGKERQKKDGHPGFIEINFRTMEERKGEFRYDKNDLIEILSNIRTLNNLERKLGGRLIVLDQDEDPRVTFERVKSENPDLIIFNDFDHFLSTNLGARKISFIEYFKNFFSSVKDSSIFLFSTNSNERYNYRIGSHEKFLFRDLDIVRHTWDNYFIIDGLRKSSYQNGDKIDPSPCSNGKLPERRKNPPNIIYNEVEELDPLSVISETIKNIGDKSMTEKCQGFLKWLERSPLYLKDNDPDGLETYRYHRRGSAGQHEVIMYDKFLQECKDLIDYGMLKEQEYENIKNVMAGVYFGPDRKVLLNPLMEEILEYLRLYINKENTKILLVISGYERNGIESILKKKGYGSKIGNDLIIGNWKDIILDMAITDKGTKIILIFLSFPKSDIDFSDVEGVDLVFIGSKRNVEIMKTIMDNRLEDFNSHPIYSTSPLEKTPPELRSIISGHRTVDNIVIDSLNDEFEDHDGVEDGEENKATTPRSTYLIEPGEHVLLSVDAEGKSIIIPYNSSILIKRATGLEEIDTGYSYTDQIRDKLKGSNVFTDRNGIFITFKYFFARSMLVKARNRRFTYSGYEWDGFKDLLSSSTHWNNLLADYVRDGEVPEERERDLAEVLSRLDLSAKDKNYIRSWWRRKIMISDTVTIYEIEKPRNLNDMIKILRKLAELAPDKGIKESEASKIYYSSLHLQKLRRAVLNHEYGLLPPELLDIVGDLESEIQKMLEGAHKFNVVNVMDAEVLEPVRAFTVMDKEDVKHHLRFDPQKL
jgi:hypothetical protein